MVNSFGSAPSSSSPSSSSRPNPAHLEISWGDELSFHSRLCDYQDVAHLVKRSDFTGEELTELRRLVAEAEKKAAPPANKKKTTQRKEKK